MDGVTQRQQTRQYTGCKSALLLTLVLPHHEADRTLQREASLLLRLLAGETRRQLALHDEPARRFELPRTGRVQAAERKGDQGRSVLVKVTLKVTPDVPRGLRVLLELARASGVASAGLLGRRVPHCLQFTPLLLSVLTCRVSPSVLLACIFLAHAQNRARRI